MRALVTTSWWWRRCCGAARGASGPGVLVSYLGAALRVVERSIEDRPDLALLTMRKRRLRELFGGLKSRAALDALR